MVFSCVQVVCTDVRNYSKRTELLEIGWKIWPVSEQRAIRHSAAVGENCFLSLDLPLLFTLGAGTF